MPFGAVVLWFATNVVRVAFCGAGGSCGASGYPPFPVTVGTLQTPRSHEGPKVMTVTRIATPGRPTPVAVGTLETRRKIERPKVMTVTVMASKNDNSYEDRDPEGPPIPVTVGTLVSFGWGGPGPIPWGGGGCIVPPGPGSCIACSFATPGQVAATLPPSTAVWAKPRSSLETSAWQIIQLRFPYTGLLCGGYIGYIREFKRNGNYYRHFSGSRDMTSIMENQIEKQKGKWTGISWWFP